MAVGASSAASVAMSSKRSGATRPSKRLLFDRRYGWVIDEWKDPSREALAGGRGMFCILPLAKAVAQVVTLSINSAAISIVEVIKKPDVLSSQSLKTALQDQVQKLLSSFRNPNLHMLPLKRNSSILCVGSLEHVNDGNIESQS